MDRALAEGVGIAVAAARWARELRVRGRQRVRGSRASRAGVLVIPVIVFGGHEDLFRLFLGLLIYHLNRSSTRSCIELLIG